VPIASLLVSYRTNSSLVLLRLADVDSDQLLDMVLQFHLICFLSCHFLVSYSYQFTARCNTKIVNREQLSLHSTAESSVEDNQASFFFSKKAFGAIGMKDSMTGVINSLNLDRPSKIQALSYNEILSAKTCIVADQTGSGKTLAYLLPIIQRMTEMKKNGTLGTTKPKSPYILIIAPTTELAR
jgi:DEAD/DEAH box helicase